MDNPREHGRGRKVDNALNLLVQAARIDPTLRDAAVLVEQEVHRLRTALRLIANEDHRGNRPYASLIAEGVLTGEVDGSSRASVSGMGETESDSGSSDG